MSRPALRWRRSLPLLIMTVLALLTSAGALPASAAASTVTLDHPTYTQGQSVIASYATGQVSSTNWVGVYQSDATPGQTSSLVWAYTPNASGSVTLATGSLAPGSYRARFFYNNGYTELANSVFFTVLSATSTGTPNGMLCTGQVGYPQGQDVVASYATTRVSSTNWVGIYADGQKPGTSNSLVWAYAPNAAGSVRLSTSGLAAGNYAAYYLYDDGSTQLANPTPFAVTSGGQGGSPNLIVNGDAECGNPSASGYDGVTVPGWRVTGLPSVVGYPTGNGFPSPSTAGPSVRGNQFFSGGPVGDATLTQTADVSAAGAAIDGGGVTYDLSGWLGGYASETSTATVRVAFLDGGGNSLGTAQLGPVTSADRGNATALLRRATAGGVPAGTRSIGTTLQLTGDPNRANRYNDAYADDLALTLSTALPVPAVPAPAAPAVPAFDHVFFVMLENKSYDQVIGNSAAPYLSGLANGNVALGSSYGLIHPSDPNYMAVAGGSTFGHVDNPMPGAIGSLTGPHIGDLAEQAGRSWRGYVEDMHSPCNLAKNGHYDPDNLPFLFFHDIAADPARCQDKLKPVTQLWTDLRSTATTPNLVWFEPNSCNTMHDCDVATGDAWMRNNLPTLFNSPAWTQQRSLLVITFDEDDSAHGQRIPTILVGSQGTTKAGYNSNTQYTHYNVLRTMEDALGLGRLTQNDQYANPINDVWR
ncbi:hypothetical protein F0L68_27635 [Solihabitans fulvus]|uniref:Phosphoesterase family protein n=1 Tax=Solihabitans fulvus TaxID=1892852 RepID=A0A5B2WZ11_9PSEU|nr:alkaline phosphatase family protein [Solihabitans fulvus]KAA2255962.1 hypothetical protein F0L68_27635 [Solihabitans fulvus]